MALSPGPDSRIIIDGRALDRFLNGPDGVVTREVIRRASVVQEGGRARVGVDSGRLRRSIVKRIVQTAGGVEVWVGSSEPHAYLHHEGTAPHMIYGSPLLVFEVNGVTIFTPQVDHPGTVPNPYLVDALHDAFG